MRQRPSLRGDAERNALVEQWQHLPRSLLRCFRGAALVSADYDDLLSAGYLALLRAAELWDPEKGAFSTYAGTCVYRRMLLAVARRARQRLHEVDWPLWTDGRGQQRPLDVEARPSRGPDEGAIAAVRAALREVPVSDRRVLDLRLQGLSLREAGERLGITCERVRQREARAHKRLRIALVRTLGADYLLEH
jgi:RNA polymerase sigma factor (sigma-70 family)